jgi:hypothetical protein
VNGEVKIKNQESNIKDSRIGPKDPTAGGPLRVRAVGPRGHDFLHFDFGVLIFALLDEG